MIARAFLNTNRIPLRCFMRSTLISKKSIIEDNCECDTKEEIICENNSTSSTAIPPLIRPEFPGKVRMGFIPEEWFQFFYPKTGVTGPYMFGAGLITYLLSKEIYVMDHEFYSGLSFAILIIWVIKKWGPATAKYADKEIDAVEKSWEEMHKCDIAELEKVIEHEKKEQWRAEGALMLIEAKRAMIDMQLEAAYREEVMKVYNEIIQKLEYQVACANVERRLSRKHMMFWIHDQVIQAIGGAKDDPNMEKTKADLSAMVIRLNDIEKEEMIRSSASKPSNPSIPSNPSD